MLGVMLGKRLGDAWYKAPEKTELERFYDYLHSDIDYMDEHSRDDFVLIREDSMGEGVSNDWQYTDKFIEGFRLFIYNGR
jgi:hypothetical protein